MRPRRRNINLYKLGLKKGTVLRYLHDTRVSAVVASENKVLFKGAIYTLSGAAKLAISEFGFRWKTVSGSEYWTYKSKTLAELRGTARIRKVQR